jgi:hypothetical protein
MLGQCSACAAARPTSARFEPARRFRGSTTGSLVVAPSCLACRTRPLWQSRTVPSLSGLLPPSLPPPRSGCPQLQPGCCDSPAVGPFIPPGHMAPHGAPPYRREPWPSGAPTARRRTDRRNVIQDRLEHDGVGHVGGGHDRGQRQPTTVADQVELAPGLATIDGICAHLVPPRLARTLMVFHTGPRPVQPALLTQPVQDHKVELVEHASLGPLGEAPPTGRRRAAAELTGGQQPPRGGCGP